MTPDAHGGEATARHADVLSEFADAVAATSCAVAEDVAVRLGPVTALTPFTAGDVLVEQHAVAHDLHVLVEGSVTYTHVVNAGLRETVTIEAMPWIPIGWSGLNLRRHRVTATPPATACC